MIHTVYIDDSTSNGKRMLEEMRKNNEGIEFEENNISAVAEPAVEYVKSDKKIITDFENPPAGYVTGEEFERMVKEKVTKHYKTNGLL